MCAQNCVVSLGGVCPETNHTLDSVEVFDIHTSKWTVLDTKLPIPIRDFCAVSIPEGILVMGGTDSTAVKRRECYLMGGSQRPKTLSAQLPLHCSSFRAVVS